MAFRARTQQDLYERSQNYPGSGTMRQLDFDTLEETAEPRESGARLLQDVISGLIAGVAATWVMTQYQVNSQKLLQKIQTEPSPEAAEKQSSSVNPTITIANEISHLLRHREVSEQHQQLAGNLVHYSFGTLVGGLFGALRARLPKAKPVSGLVYGAGVWGAADELLMPALGIAKWWPEYPTAVHLNALGAHLVYGATLDMVQQALGRLLEQGEQIGRQVLATSSRGEGLQAEAEQAEFRAPWVEPQASRMGSSATRRFSRFEVGERAQPERQEKRRYGGKRAA